MDEFPLIFTFFLNTVGKGSFFIAGGDTFSCSDPSPILIDAR